VGPAAFIVTYFAGQDGGQVGKGAIPAPLDDGMA
jgi:hypothetical protein